MGYHQILVPLDGSLLSEYILPKVERFAAAFGSKLTLLHVVPAEEMEATSLTPSQKKARADIVRYLQGVEDSLARRGLKAQWTLRCGDPAEEIAWYVDRHEVDLVIMSTHGQGDARQRDVGSVAAETLKRINIPVVLLRVPEAIAKL